jgi:hypothetical protein
MNVLVACEYSGRVRDAFLAKGHNAVSCDFYPTEVAGPHYQGDVLNIINDGWDLMIAHPDCTYLTNSAAWAYKEGPYHQKVKPETPVGAEWIQLREEALQFVRTLLGANIKMIALENPVGVISTLIRPASQYINPYDFGDDASKKTGLWLNNLPLLVPTDYIPPRIAGGKKRWGNQTDSGQNRLSPGPDRWKDRSRTYVGIAKAMADQWNF